MKKLTATICLTLAVLLGSVGCQTTSPSSFLKNEVSRSDFQKGLTAAQSGDFATALREWKTLAEQGDASAQFNLGLMYRNGEGVPQDDKIAVKWYKLAAEQGLASAQTSLGWMYDKGKGLTQNNKTAAKWYKLAAEQGDAKSQFNLGVMYQKGRGVTQNDKTAVKWYRLAAEQGVGDAQGNLGVMYAFGDGVLKDYIYAHMWGDIAATNGNELGEKLRDTFEKKMTPAQIAEAQKLARECVRMKYKGC